MIKKFILFQAFMALCGVSAFAVPANPNPFQKQQPDGSSHTVRLVGDEHLHFFVDEAGRQMTEGADGWLYLLDADENGNLVQTDIKAFSEQGTAYKPDAKKIDKAINLQWQAEKIKRSPVKNGASNGLSTRSVPSIPRESSFPCEGDQYGIAILVEFQDVKFKSSTARDDFWRQLNEEGFADYDATGSVRDFYMASSGGKFRPTWDVFGPVTVSREMAYYGQNMGGSASDMFPEQMVIEACQLVDKDVDFTKYDRDNDGYIDNVYIFYAGYGENEIGGNNSIWPHSADIIARHPEMVYKFDGKTLNHYACNNELNGGHYQTGIGTFVHEFGHVLGLPDLYNLETSLAFTPNYWDAMDYGGPNNNLGRTPPNFSAVERFLLGWIDLRELTDPANITLDAITTNDALILPTDSEMEFYIFENRQQSGWDAYIPGHGMLVWHLDYIPVKWLGGFVNNDPDHMCVDLIEADGHPYMSSNSTDAFPGEDRRYTEITDNTRVKLVSWSGNWQAKPITDIREEFGIIYFRYDGGVDEISSTTAEASDITGSSFKISWTNPYVGCYYTINVTTTDKDGNEVIVEGYDNKPVGYKTEYVVTGLQPSTTYNCYVTPSDYGFGLTGEPSNVVTVTTKESEEAGIDGIIGSDAGKLKVEKSGNYVSVTGISGEYLAVYRADGALVMKLPAEEKVSFELPVKGLYIITDGRNKTKIII